jgi:hypothetical protein
MGSAIPWKMTTRRRATTSMALQRGAIPTGLTLLRSTRHISQSLRLRSRQCLGSRSRRFFVLVRLRQTVNTMQPDVRFSELKRLHMRRWLTPISSNSRSPICGSNSWPRNKCPQDPCNKPRTFLTVQHYPCQTGINLTPKLPTVLGRSKTSGEQRFLPLISGARVRLILRVKSDDHLRTTAQSLPYLTTNSTPIR